MRSFLNKLVNSLRNAFLAGLVVVLPVGVTIWVLVSAVSMVDSMLDVLPSRLNPEHLLQVDLPGLGILITVVLVTAVGAGMRYYLGRQIYGFLEGVLLRVPLLSGVYQGLKKLIETLFSKEGMRFRQVVMVEYPRRGAWAIAFLTGDAAWLRPEDEFGGDEPVSVFLPTTPNPTSGFYLLLPRSEVRRLDLSVEEAFKLIMSAGIVKPSEPRNLRGLGEIGGEVEPTEEIADTRSAAS